jgi:putative pyruvate formate lyase activating enzyme
MSQFTPVYKAFEHKKLSRKTSTFEYNYVANLIAESGFEGFCQQKASAEKKYIPQFYGEKYF